MLAAPLMMGNDIRAATPETLKILLDKEVIAVDQDPLGKQGVKVRDDGDLEVWSKVLHDGSRAVVLFNRGPALATTVDMARRLGEDRNLRILHRHSSGRPPVKTRFFVGIMTLLGATCVFSAAIRGAERFIGSWALTLPDGRAGWLGVNDKDGRLSAELLWGAGSVVPVGSLAVEDNKLIIQRGRKLRRRKGSSGAAEFVETIIAERDGETLKLTRLSISNARPTTRQEFTGKWCPPPPPKPDLSQVEFAEPIVLFDGKSLDGWTLTDPHQVNGWSAQNGELVNKPVQPASGRHISYGSLRTVDEFEDFNLKLELSVRERENSGVYLRGIYEIQVSDSYGQDLDSHNMGAVYSRIAPRVSAEKPAGQWQTLDITLSDRHVTVVLNGKTIIDNEPVLGCTGGALWSDPFRPGPIYLQGDHTGIRYRNIVLTPIIKTGKES